MIFILMALLIKNSYKSHVVDLAEVRGNTQCVVNLSIC